MNTLMSKDITYSTKTNKLEWNQNLVCLEEALKNFNSILQIQFNDKNNKKISSKAWVLKPESNDIYCKKFIPVSNDLNDLKVPENTKYLIVFGQVMMYISEAEANIKQGIEDNSFQEEYIPTIGVNIREMYLKNPKKSILLKYDIDYLREIQNTTNIIPVTSDSIMNYNNIVSHINIENNTFNSLNTSSPIVHINSLAHRSIYYRSNKK